MRIHRKQYNVCGHLFIFLQALEMMASLLTEINTVLSTGQD